MPSGIYVRTEQARANMSAARIGFHPSDETRAKLSAMAVGRPVSSEARAKLSIVKSEQCASLEWRAMISARNWKGGRRVTMCKARAKRRLLGFVPLNVPLVGCDGHHIDKERVIYIPKKLHRSIYHNIWTGEGMVAINALATSWLAESGHTEVAGGTLNA
jgi:hypothetical protein